MSQEFKSTLDFYEIKERFPKANTGEVYPDYKIDEKTDDLMIRGDSFYAVWDPDLKRWNRNIRSIKRLVDQDVKKYLLIRQMATEDSGTRWNAKYLKYNSSGKWAEFKSYIRNLSDDYHRLDEKVSFKDPNDASVLVDYKGRQHKKEDYVSKCLPYSLQMDSECPAWDELISTLYDPEERDKIEWAIGSIICGDSKRIQKFLVLYGKQGTGKGTILDIVAKLFNGYCATFKAENLVHGGDNFNLDFLSEDPLVAIDADTNLSRIESNVLINQIVSHEQLKVNEKFKNKYPNKPICMLMLGTNQQVKITDAKSGIIRRLIDVESSSRKIPEDEYFELLDRIDYELGAIAGHCLKVYQELGRTYYSDYVPVRMMYRSDPFFNFMEEVIYDYIKDKDEAIERGDHSVYSGIAAMDLWRKWKAYCEDSGIEHTRKRFEIIDEAKNYFKEYVKETRIDGVHIRGLLRDLRYGMFNQGDFEQNKTRRERKKKNQPLSESKDDSVVLKEDPEKYSYGWLNLNQTISLLDKELADCIAQYARKATGLPIRSWNHVSTKLKDLDTSQLHWVKGPGKLIFVDYDKHGPDGKKDLALNLKAAVESGLPKTYTELSNSGGGLHSYYWYEGDVNELSNLLDAEIEIKTFPEDKNLSIRRRVSRCNDLPIARISSGLPFKEKKKTMLNKEGIKDEQHLRNVILKTIAKEIQPYGQEPKTVICVKYIRDVLKEAQDKGMVYDLHDLENVIYSFAANSHHNSAECIDMFYSMELTCPKKEVSAAPVVDSVPYKEEAPIIILDCEVVRNMTLIVYKELEADGVAGIFKKPEERNKCIRLFNPKPYQIEQLLEMRIVGHNVTGYDNHILYALYLGKKPEEVFNISQSIINGDRAPYREARNISYTDTLDVASEKKSLKKLEIEMHIPHKEMEIEWDKPLPESEWERLALYCENDVLATEAYFLSPKWQADFKARKILADLTGLTVNESTNNLVAQLLFGDEKNPQKEFIYPDLKKEFPEYRFEFGKSYYRHKIYVDNSEDFSERLTWAMDYYKNLLVGYNPDGRWIEVDELIGEGGRVYAEPGGYYHVITFDVSGMHPSSYIVEKGFGIYTQTYKDLYEARIAIKHKDYDTARKLFGGRLAPYLDNEDDADDLAYALKIVLNSTYGAGAAHYKNRIRDDRNVDNWVAKRGALFMEKLRLEVQKRGGHVIHIKTDSIKLVQPSQELQDFVVQFGADHGYTFEVESKYERICLVNHAVYIAYREKDDPSWLKECKKAKKKVEETGKPYIEPTRWTATGAQFAHPFVFKQLFSREPMEFWDFCEMKTVKTALYLDLNERLENVEQEEKEKKKIETRMRKLRKILDTGKDGTKDISDLDREKMKAELDDLPKDIDVLDKIIAKGHHYSFVGKAGEFMPVKDGCGGGLLMRKESDEGFGYATGAKGYRWVESETLQKVDNWQEFIDIRYFRGLTDEAVKTIQRFTDFELFVRGEEGIILPEDRIPEYNTDPWVLPCKTEQYAYCSDCPDFVSDENGYSCKKGYTITNQILGESKEILL